MQDQKDQLAQCKGQLDALLEERGVAEQAFTDAYAASLGVYEEQLDAAHTADQDAYHALRTRCARIEYPYTEQPCSCSATPDVTSPEASQPACYWQQGSEQQMEYVLTCVCMHG